MTSVTPTTFLYKGRGADGKVTKGRLEAPNEGTANARLIAMGLTPISVSEAGTGLNREIELGFLKKGVKLKDLAVMARQMATMTGAGVSLLRTLNILAEQSETRRFARRSRRSRRMSRRGRPCPTRCCGIRRSSRRS